jgi:hypothetical protein
MTQSKDTFTFNGFEPANTTPVPDILFDELLSWLSGSELKVLLYIIRRTRGFKKDSDAISLSQFQKGIVTKDGKQLDKGCGIDDRQTIINALASLEKKRCIVSEKCKTAKGDNATTVYRILFSQGVVGKANQGSREKATTPVGNSNHRSGKKPTTVVGNSNPQETVLQDTDIQQTVLQDEREIPPNTLDNTAIVSSDTAHAFAHPGEVDEAMIREIIAQSSLSSEGEITEEFIQRTIDAFKHRKLVELRARPGLSEHPDDQLPSKQDEQSLMLPEHTHENIEHPFTCYYDGQYYAACPLEKPQGDAHATAVPGHPHRMGDAAAPGGARGHSTMDNGQVAAPETGPVLEAGQKEIAPKKGNTSDGLNHDHTGDTDHLSNDHLRNQNTQGQGRVAQTPPTPMPAQSLPSPPG